MAGGQQQDLLYRVAKQIAVVRRQRGMSQEGLAAILDIAVKNVQRIEAGGQNLSLTTLERVCSALDVTVEALMGGAAARVEADVASSSGQQRVFLPRALQRLEKAGHAVRAATERGRRPTNAVPVMTLEAAAGQLVGEARTVEVAGWVMLPRAKGAPPKGQFVAEVRGRSMEPRIKNGALVLFGPAGPPPFQDRILLVAHGSLTDDEELGGPYALKRVRRMRKLVSGVTRVVLESLNPDFTPIVIDTREDNELRVIAELVSVLVQNK